MLATRSNSESATPATVLVVEDEPVIASDIRQILAGRGYIVPKSVSTGRRAIDTAGQLRPALVLMDIRLEGDMDGVTAALEIRSRFAIPVVYLSSHSDDATLSRAVKTRPDGYLVKPFSDRDLVNTVAMALERTAHSSSMAVREPIQRERLAALGTQVAVIVHEIDNPLASMMANVGCCVAEAERICAHLEKLELTPENRPVFDGVMDAVCGLEGALADASTGAGRIRSIVAALKGYGRVDEVAPGSLDVERVLDAAMRTIAHTMRAIAVRKQYGATPLVQGRAGPLTQVFTHLLGNAADAIRQGCSGVGVICIRTATAADGSAIVEVHDNGAGIAAGVLPRIFDPFFSTKPAGMGLGLSICRDILVSFGGDIAAESAAGKGTTFRVTLPPAPAP